MRWRSEKHVDFDRKQYTGYIDNGTGFDDDLLPEAREALVLMLVAMTAVGSYLLAIFLSMNLLVKPEETL